MNEQQRLLIQQNAHPVLPSILTGTQQRKDIFRHVLLNQPVHGSIYVIANVSHL